MKSVPENSYLKTCSTSFPGSQRASFLFSILNSLQVCQRSAAAAAKDSSPTEKCESRSIISNSFRPHGLYSSPGQNTRVGSLSLLQGIFPTQGSNWGLLHCRSILYQLSYQGSPLPAEANGKCSWQAPICS